MASIKELVNRINSVKATQQITKAMKMVAATKRGKSQQKATQMRLYAQKITQVLAEGVLQTDVPLHQRTLQRASEVIKRHFVLVIASDRGLCGAFNTHVLKAAEQFAATLVDQHEVILFPIGKKAVDFFQTRPYTCDKSYVDLSQHMDADRVCTVAHELLHALNTHTCDRVTLVYNQFQNPVTYITQTERLLPLDHLLNRIPTTAPRHIYEPSLQSCLETLIPQVVQAQLWYALLSSAASEHGARMATMSKATDNAENLLKSLRLSYNRTRQSAITREIAEIVAAAEAISQ